MRTAIVLLMAAGLGLNVYSVKAQDAVRRALAEELLNEMQMKENLEKSFAMIKRMIPSQAKSVEQAAGKENQPSSGTNMADKMATPNGKIMDEMAQEMSWEKMKDDYISLYAETFTEEELKGIIAFYKSSAGQAFTTKQPELMRRTMELTQKRMLQWMPKIQAMSKDRIKSSHTGVKEAAPPAEGTRPRQTTWFSAGPGWRELSEVAKSHGHGLSSFNHATEHYQKILSKSQPGSTIVLLFALDHSDKNVPAEYVDLLPMPWDQIEATLRKGEAVEAAGKSHEREIVLLAAPTESQLKELIHSTKLLSANPPSK